MAKFTLPTRRLVLSVLALLALLLAGLPGEVPRARAVSNDIVIYQVYGGGGNAGAPYNADFIALFNRGATPVSLGGMSIQYASATGTGLFGSSTTMITELPGATLAPGQYFLIQEGTGTNGVPLDPPPDFIDPTPIAMSASAGKVALVNGTAPLGCNGSAASPCSPEALERIVDLVGWGNANFFEGSTGAPTTSNTLAIFRKGGGCVDTDNNSADFELASPIPVNSASPLNPCSGDAPPTVTAVNPADGAADVPVDSNLSVSFSEAVDASPASFTLACTSSGTHTITLSGGPVAFTLDPDADFVHGESCTLTVLAAGISDQDTDDPPDNMPADFSASFTVVSAGLPVCGDPATYIHTVQGAGLQSPMVGANVTVEGVVVADLQGTNEFNGFYLQEEDSDADADPATSEGIFVFNTSFPVNAGDKVRVTGTVSEFSSSGSTLTELGNITNLQVCGSGFSVTPTDVLMPFDDPDFPERYEGMLVRLPQALVISEYFNYDRFGEIVLALPLDGESRPFTPTAIDEPGAPAQARALANSLRRITLDDAKNNQNPAVLRHPNGDPFSLSNLFRGGDLVQNTVGVLSHRFGLYRIQPTAPADYIAVNPRPTAPEPVGGSIRVAAMNTLNFFLTLDYPTGDPRDNKCGPNQNVECRGADADQPDEFTRQRNKLIAAIAGLDADIVGLNELENTPGVDPLGDPVNGLAAGLNDLLGPGTYASIDTGVIGTDAIRVGILYKPGKVVPVGDFKIIDSSVDPRFLESKNRPSLAQTFQDISSGERFTVVVNHLKSKGSDCNDVGDPDIGDGQGNCNQTRLAAAQALVDWLATDPTGSGDPDFLIMGDLNSYAMEDPIDAILAGADDTPGTADDFTNLILRFQGPYAHSYVFDGQAGYLDHALASASLAAKVTGAAEWHINADEADVIDYDTSFKPDEVDAIYAPDAYRASDHDPVVVGIQPNRALSVSAGGPYEVGEGGSVQLEASGSDPDGDALAFSWDLDGDGVFETPGQSVSFSAAGLDGPGSATVSVRAVDPSGASAEAQATVNIVNLPPQVSLPQVSPDVSVQGEAVTASAAFSDPFPGDSPFTCTVDYGDGSGPVAGQVDGTTCTGPQHAYASYGSYLVTVTVTDKDSAAGQAVAIHTVVFDFTGFLPPVDNPPVFNDANAGRGIPVKFRLGGYQGMDIFAPGYPKLVQIPCQASSPVDVIEETIKPSLSNLTYDPVKDMYVYAWKTEKSWAGTCRQLVIRLVDGTEHRANFSFR